MSLGLVTPHGYAIVETHRSSQRGGVGVIYRDFRRAQLEKCEKYSLFEHQTVYLFSDSDVLRIITLYNPSGNFITVFHTEFNDVLCHLQTITGKHLIVGDFNFHVNKQSDSGANKFKALLNQHSLSQHVTKQTHTAENTLDLVITRNDLLVTGPKSDQSVDSDNFALIFNLSFQSLVQFKELLHTGTGSVLILQVSVVILWKHLMDLLPKIQNLRWEVVILC